jgi:multidrug efflux pump subunit AcrB
LHPKEISSSLYVSYSINESSPDIIEGKITSLFEGAFAQLSKLKHITSRSGYNSGFVKLEFEKGIDMPVKELEIASLVKRIYPALPAGTSYPVISHDNNSLDGDLQPILSYDIISPAPLYLINKQVSSLLINPLAGLRGIQDIKVSETNRPVLRVSIDEERCDALHISPSFLVNSLREYFTSSYPGTVHMSGGRQYFIQIPAPEGSIANVENVVMQMPGHRPVKIRDVASVTMFDEEPKSFLRINGKNAVRLSFYARDGENKVFLCGQIKQHFKHIFKKLPEGYTALLRDDISAPVTQDVSQNLWRTGLSICMLIIFTLIIYRSWRPAVSIILALIVNISLILIFAWLLRINVHLYTITGITVSFGFMTDNAIVMTDYFRQFRNRKIFPALLCATLCTVLALSLIFLLPDEERRNLSEFAVVVILSLSLSLLVCLLFIPASSELLGITTKAINSRDIRFNRGAVALLKLYQRLISGLKARKRVFILGLLLLFGIPFYLLPDQIKGDGMFFNTYNSLFGNSYFREKIRPTLDKFLGGVTRDFTVNVNSGSAYVHSEKPVIYLDAKLPYGTTASQLNAIIEPIERDLIGIEGIDKFESEINHSQSAKIIIHFKPGSRYRNVPAVIKSGLISRALDLGGLRWSVSGFGQGFSNLLAAEVPGYRIILRGYNYDQLRNQAVRLSAAIGRHQRIKDVNIDDNAELEDHNTHLTSFQINPTELGLRNTNTFEISNKLAYLSATPVVAASIISGGTYTSLIITGRKALGYTSYDFLHRNMRLDSGRVLRMNDIGHMDTLALNNNITREDRQYVRIFSFSYLGSKEFGDKYVKSQLRAFKENLPVGYKADLQEDQNNMISSGRKLTLVIVFIVIVFFICSILFENLKEPLYIICAIPIAFIGHLLTFIWGDYYFDQGGYASLIILGGLVTNAAVFIINDFNRLKKNYMNVPKDKLIVKAIYTRAKTIFLVSLATCCGLAPFLFEGQTDSFWFSLAVGTIGGIISVWFSIFLLLPVLLSSKQSRVKI